MLFEIKCKLNVSKETEEISKIIFQWHTAEEIWNHVCGRLKDGEIYLKNYNNTIVVLNSMESLKVDSKIGCILNNCIVYINYPNESKHHNYSSGNASIISCFPHQSTTNIKFYLYDK